MRRLAIWLRCCWWWGRGRRGCVSVTPSHSHSVSHSASRTHSPSNTCCCTMMPSTSLPLCFCSAFFAPGPSTYSPTAYTVGGGARGDVAEQGEGHDFNAETCVCCVGCLHTCNRTGQICLSTTLTIDVLQAQDPFGTHTAAVSIGCAAHTTYHSTHTQLDNLLDHLHDLHPDIRWGSSIALPAGVVQGGKGLDSQLAGSRLASRNFTTPGVAWRCVCVATPTHKQPARRSLSLSLLVLSYPAPASLGQFFLVNMQNSSG